MREKIPTHRDNPTLSSKQLFLERFIYMRQLKEDLPPYKVMPHHEGYSEFKCRRIVFVGLMGDLSYMITKEILKDPTAIEVAQQYIHYLQNDFPIEKTNPLGPRYTTEADFKYLNEILDYFIAHLSQDMIEE